ncbi:DNA polymerase III subunit gamma and tau [Actinosynnema sp. NPDC020468]|uniref:DNA polymerase III subunit gamma and tau n=1 Tax=Actinosynnema sp. NPDC020468 TaxID=3154488 RepID=UPI00340F9A32
MALALYRKYRPATFGEVVGQEHVTDPLRIALGAGRVNHAYLFSGPRGCGKTSSARILARSLNCVNGPTPDPCGQCNSCVGLAPNGSGSVDVVELDAASHGGVDDARELRDKAFYAPAEARYRVFIIDEAHMVTTQGFNALLKIVEEPPEHLIFIFATTEPDKVLPTIRSRTHHYPFRLIPPSAMRALLERNCEAEGVKVEPAVLPLVIRAGGGSARDTQSVMDQLLSGAGPEGVTYERAISLLGVTDVALIDDVVDGLSAGDGSKVFGTIDRLVDAGHDPRRFASDLLDRLRDLVLLHAVRDAAERGLVSAPEDELARMVGQRDRTRPGTVTRWAEVLHQGLTDMRGSTAPRLVLELVTARMLLPSASDAESAVLQRVERLEQYGPPTGALAPAGGPMASAPPAPAAVPPPQAASSVAPPVAPPAQGTASEGRFQRPSQRAAQPEPRAVPEQSRPEPTPPADAPAHPGPASAPPEPTGAEPTGPASNGSASSGSVSSGSAPTDPVSAASAPAAPAPTDAAPAHEPVPAASEAGGFDVAAVKKRWPEVLAVVRGSSRSTEAMLTNAAVTDVDGVTITVSHPSQPLARRLGEARNVEAIAKAVGQVLGGTWQVRCVHGDATAAPARPAQQRQQRPAPQRPSQQAQRSGQPQRPESTGRPAPRSSSDDIPPPPEPPDLDDPLPPPPEPDFEPEPVDEEEMMRDASRPTDPDAERLDPEAVVLQLLKDQLGARPLKG